jgi:hypothetical protein
MNNDNGTATATRDASLTPMIAQSIIDSLHKGQSRDLAAPASTASSLLSFATALDSLVATSPEFRRAIEEAMARSARLALAGAGIALPSLDDFVAGLRTPVTTRGGTVVRAFWWGFHIQISHEDLQSFLNTAQPVNALIGAIGGGVPSPAAPFIALAAAFVGGALGLINGLDHGSGVCISMSWFAPGVFVPTSV